MWVISRESVFENFGEFERLGWIGDLLLEINCSLRRAGDGIAIDGVRRDQLRLGRSAEEFDAALATVFLWERRGQTRNQRARFHAGSGGIDRQRVRDRVFNRHEFGLAGAMGFVDDRFQIIHLLPVAAIGDAAGLGATLLRFGTKYKNIFRLIAKMKFLSVDHDRRNGYPPIFAQRLEVFGGGVGHGFLDFFEELLRRERIFEASAPDDFQQLSCERDLASVLSEVMDSLSVFSASEKLPASNMARAFTTTGSGGREGAGNGGRATGIGYGNYRDRRCRQAQPLKCKMLLFSFFECAIRDGGLRDN